MAISLTLAELLARAPTEEQKIIALQLLGARADEPLDYRVQLYRRWCGFVSISVLRSDLEKIATPALNVPPSLQQALF